MWPIDEVKCKAFLMRIFSYVEDPDSHFDQDDIYNAKYSLQMEDKNL